MTRVRQLEVVAVSDDGTYVLLASAEDAARATHSVRIDSRLQAAIRGELDDSERRESELSPKEIQSRLRSGESNEQVAKAAKVPVSRVMRYAGPVISERERIIEQARAAAALRSRGAEPTSVPLGELVDKRLAVTPGLRAETVTWSARRRDDGAWIVALDYTAKGGSRSASWLWQPAERELTAINNLATRITVDDGPSGRRRSPAGARSTTRRSAPRATRPRKSAVTAKPVKAATRPARPAPKAASATSVAPKRPAAKRAPAVAAPMRARKAVKAVKPVKVAKAVKPVKATRAAKVVTVTPPVRKRPTKVAARRAAVPVEPPVTEIAAKRGGRVAVPSWSDVLLGVQAPPAARGRRRT
jgi:Protein of unknown function (DUF3071)